DAEALRDERAAGARGLGHGEGLRADLAVELALEVHGRRLHLGPDPAAAGHPQSALQLHLAVEPAVHRQILPPHRHRNDRPAPHPAPSFLRPAPHTAPPPPAPPPGAPPPSAPRISSPRGKNPMPRPPTLASPSFFVRAPVALCLPLAVGTKRPG